MSDADYEPNRLLDLLPVYYRHCFPSKLMCQWLSYKKAEYLTRREFSFTLSGDIYIRYLSFAGEKDLSRALEHKNPVKIDIGAVYNVNPTDGRKGLTAMRAEERELVFDIDMTDYDDVRTCCQGADVCKKCWKFLAIACKILNEVLTSHFGFKRLLWVFSGRRGIHVWVCDQCARTLTVEERAAIAEYLSLVDGGKFMTKKCSLDQRLAVHHPLVTAALAVIDAPVANGLTVFTQLAIDEQKLFDTDKNWRNMLSLCSNSQLKSELESLVKKGKRAGEKFDAVSNYCVKYKEQHTKQLGINFIEELKLQLCYPRLDINVSKGLNHLLKSPFVVHPKTGRICVPFDVQKVDSFDPRSVPTVSRVVAEYEAVDGSGDAKGKSCLSPALLLMSQFVTNLPEDQLSF